MHSARFRLVSCFGQCPAPCRHGRLIAQILDLVGKEEEIMKKYEEAEPEVIAFETADVIRTS